MSSKATRFIPQVPEKILDAPELLDDYYLNLLDWSSTNILSVALGQTVYLWNASSGDISELVQVQGENYITSVSWVQGGAFLAVGTAEGEVQLYDAETRLRLGGVRGCGVFGQLLTCEYVCVLLLLLLFFCCCRISFVAAS